MSTHLRDLIKIVRASRTAQEEREVITKELAAVRTSCASEDNEYRPRNVAKMLYIHMLGYNTQFGQMECLKLIVSPHYSDKRIGYLGLMVLLDEKQEVLMLVTNSLKNDLNHINQYVVGLALCALGNISSASIARDTAPEVEKLLGSTNPYVRKKAALCALRILRKVPDLMENFLPRIKVLLVDRNHGVLITALTLMIELCIVNPEHNIPTFRKLVPQLVRIMKTLTQSGYNPEYDINGITDPFLQVKLLKILGILGAGDASVSEQMNDLLAQVATNTDSLRNVGNAILYEIVQTIMSIESENGLRVLAVNILGRFLSNRDNNIRYVALNTLAKVVAIEPEAVQRHRGTIVDCLKDADISIRRRALELIYVLVNSSNVRVLVRELLSFLTVADVEFRPDLTARLCVVTEQFAPTKRWHVDTILKIMSVAGSFVPDEVCSNLIALIAQTPELQSYAVHKMYLSLSNDVTQQSMIQVGVWCIGEFADLLIVGESGTGEDGKEFVKVTEQDVINLLKRIIRAPTTLPSSRVYVLTAAMKLSVRFNDNYQKEIRDIIKSFTTDLNLELQSRACEFDKVLTKNTIKRALLERMPAPEPKPISAPSVARKDTKAPSTTTSEVETQPIKTSEPPPATELPLINFGDGPSTETSTVESPLDALNKIFAGSAGVPLNLGAPTMPSVPLGLTSTVPTIGLSSPAPLPIGMTTPPVVSLNGHTFIAFQNAGLTIQFQCVKQLTAPHLTLINASYANSLPQPMENFVFQTAVPKYLKLQLLPASSNVIPPLLTGTVTQVIKIANTLHLQHPVVLRIKVEWTIAGKKEAHEATVNNFPPGV
eukprot:TRINITY_DN4040_c0_g2_i5.p1 TRINITY_DN4040_c0_g2~~TRINITY_DN4040_c0_g2_i5.p1  ORF type:complete len:828 (-),score=149.24 TRINITY_DN4040_c0_g2_i5:70-2553(-)